LPRAQLTDLYGTDLGIVDAGASSVQVAVGANPVYVEAVQ